MFTQFFGNYLLHNQLVSPEQLSEGLNLQKTTRLKLGVLAINAGYMTAEQVDKVHMAQQRIDKRIGDIAVEMGFLTNAQIDELLSSQKSGHLLLGQALVDKGYMTTMQFEQALHNYKAENSITDDDFTNSQNDKISNVIKKFYKFDSSANAKHYTDYIALLFKNLIRFIGDDFTPLDAEVITSYNCLNSALQKISGEFALTTIIEADDNAYIDFAERYANEELTHVDEMVHASVGEFFNLHNGLFTVNFSNDYGIELQLEPQETTIGAYYENLKSAYKLPLAFPFGIVNVIIAAD